MHWICGAIAVTATGLLILRSPLPRYLKLSLPFTYFLLYQYAVVARSYVLAPIFLFLIALFWKRNPLLVALLLGLLANVALHAAVISGGLAVVYFVERIRDGGVRDSGRRRHPMGAVFVLLAFYAFAIWTAWPPHDLLSHIANTRRMQSSGMPSFAAKFLISLVMGICPKPWWLSIPFWIAIGIWLHMQRSLFYLLPVLFFAVFCGAVSCGWWHAGLLIPLLICMLWVTWPPSNFRFSRREVFCLITVAALVGEQILWSAFAIDFDVYNAFSPDLAAAEFLRPLVRQGDSIAITYFDDPYLHAYHGVGILPYFDHNIYINQPDFFWAWSDENPTEERFWEVLPSHPSVVVVEVRLPGVDSPVNLQDSKAQTLSQDGYGFTHMFCGSSPIGYLPAEKNCHLIFQRAVALDAAGSTPAKGVATQK